jgi:hypothetical protein
MERPRRHQRDDGGRCRDFRPVNWRSTGAVAAEMSAVSEPARRMCERQRSLPRARPAQLARRSSPTSMPLSPCKICGLVVPSRLQRRRSQKSLRRLDRGPLSMEVAPLQTWQPKRLTPHREDVWFRHCRRQLLAGTCDPRSDGSFSTSTSVEPWGYGSSMYWYTSLRCSLVSNWPGDRGRHLTGALACVCRRGASGADTRPARARS